MRIAVIGSGIGGISTATLLSPTHSVDIYESSERLGGHTHTLDVTADGLTFPVDTRVHGLQPAHLSKPHPFL